MSVYTSFVFDPANCLSELRELGLLRENIHDSTFWLRCLSQTEDHALVGMYMHNDLFGTWIIVKSCTKVFMHQNSVILFYEGVEKLIQNPRISVIEKYTRNDKLLVQAQVQDLDICLVNISGEFDLIAVTQFLALWNLSKANSVENCDKYYPTREAVIQSALAWKSSKSQSVDTKATSKAASISTSEVVVSAKPKVISELTLEKSTSITSTLKDNSNNIASTPIATTTVTTSTTSTQSTTVTSVSFTTPSVTETKTKIKSQKTSESKSSRTAEKQSATDKEKVEFPLGRRIDNLYPSLWHQGEWRQITANTPRPIPFCTELFEGHVLLMVNTKRPEDLFYSRFEGTRYVFEIQVQGKFRKIPNGHLFFGAEITKKMELGLLTRGMCGSLLQLGRAVNPFVHHSFGDKSNTEYPHLAAPVWSTVDKFVITKPGEVPPPLGIVFVEDVAQRNIRRKDAEYKVDIDLDTIYSFSFKTSNIELIDWRLVNIPLMKSMDLHTFWNDGDIRLVAYCIPYGSANSNLGKMNNQYLPKAHAQSVINYFFSLEVKHKSNHPEITTPPVGLDYTPAMAAIAENSPKPSRDDSDDESEGGDSVDDEVSVVESDDDDDDDIDQEELDNQQGDKSLFEDSGDDHSSSLVNIPTTPESPMDNVYTTPKTNNMHISTPIKTSETEVSYKAEIAGNMDIRDVMIEDHYKDSPMTPLAKYYGNNGVLKSDNNQLNNSANVSNQTAKSTSPESYGAKTLFEMGRPSDLNYVAAFMNEPLVFAAIEIDDRRSSRKNARRTVYAIMLDPIKRFLETSHGQIATRSVPCVLRTYKEWTAVLPLKKTEPRPYNYNRLSEAEQRRQDLDSSYRELLKKGFQNNHKLKEKFNSFVNGGSHTDAFLSSDANSWITSKHLRSGLSPFLMEALVCVQVANLYWNEECMGLTRNEIVFIKSASRSGKRHRLHILLESLIDVQAIDSYEHSFSIGSDTCYLLLSTFSKQYLVMMRGREVRDRWVENLKDNVMNIQNYYSNTSETSCDRNRRHHLDLLVHPKSWQLGDRDILNGRTFTRGSLSILDAKNKLLQYSQRPVELVENLLQRILNICALTNSTSGADSIPNTINESANTNKEHSTIFKIPGIPSILRKESSYEERALSGGGNNNSLNSGTNSNININNTNNSNNTNTNNNSSINSSNINMNFASSPDMIAQSPSNRTWGPFSLLTKGPEESMEDLGVVFDQSMSNELVEQWIEFLDGISMLQNIDLESLELAGDEKLAMFLNLYHCMLLHGFLIMGLPDSIYKWSGFYGACAYEAFGDVFSLVELEHNIIRNGMPKPSMRENIVNSMIPNSKYSFALNRKDFRLLWAINCGSESLCGHIPLFTAAALSNQLDAMVSISLESQLQFADNSVVLPQICQWYIKDFDCTGDGSASSTSSSKSILSSLAHFTKGEKFDALTSLISSSKKSIKIQYSPFIFKCRLLERFGDHFDSPEYLHGQEFDDVDEDN